MIELVGIINIGINPVLIDTGGFELTWHGLFTALGIAAGVWLAVRLARRAKISEDDAMSIAVVSVLSGIIGARLLWVIEHTDQIGSVGDIFALTDGGIQSTGQWMAGVLGGFSSQSLQAELSSGWLSMFCAGDDPGQAVGTVCDFVKWRALRQCADCPGVSLQHIRYGRAVVGRPGNRWLGFAALADSWRDAGRSTSVAGATSQSSTS